MILDLAHILWSMKYTPLSRCPWFCSTWMQSLQTLQLLRLTLSQKPTSPSRFGLKMKKSSCRWKNWTNEYATHAHHMQCKSSFGMTTVTGDGVMFKRHSMSQVFLHTYVWKLCRKFLYMIVIVPGDNEDASIGVHKNANLLKLFASIKQQTCYASDCEKARLFPLPAAISNFWYLRSKRSNVPESEHSLLSNPPSVI